jgi:hypothetical protein
MVYTVWSFDEDALRSKVVATLVGGGVVALRQLAERCAQAAHAAEPDSLYLYELAVNPSDREAWEADFSAPLDESSVTDIVRLTAIVVAPDLAQIAVERGGGLGTVDMWLPQMLTTAGFPGDRLVHGRSMADFMPDFAGNLGHAHGGWLSRRDVQRSAEELSAKRTDILEAARETGAAAIAGVTDDKIAAYLDTFTSWHASVAERDAAMRMIVGF